ncbi:hypothetical protein Goarm_022219, partial [Gossypium armourianum]|nr:hypothetical protein [Gossypium armourianum]
CKESRAEGRCQGYTSRGVVCADVHTEKIILRERSLPKEWNKKSQSTPRKCFFTVDLGFKKVIVEGDSLTIIKTLQSFMDDDSTVND